MSAINYFSTTSWCNRAQRLWVSSWARSDPASAGIMFSSPFLGRENNLKPIQIN
jgi:hypothetical protein